MPAERLVIERPLLGAVAVAAARVRASGRSARKVDKLSCVRFGSARYSVPNRLIGTTVTIATTATMLTVDRAGHRGDARRARAGRAG